MKESQNSWKSAVGLFFHKKIFQERKEGFFYNCQYIWRSNVRKGKVKSFGFLFFKKTYQKKTLENEFEWVEEGEDFCNFDETEFQF